MSVGYTLPKSDQVNLWCNVDAKTVIELIPQWSIEVTSAERYNLDPENKFLAMTVCSSQFCDVSPAAVFDVSSHRMRLQFGERIFSHIPPAAWNSTSFVLSVSRHRVKAASQKDFQSQDRRLGFQSERTWLSQVSSVCRRTVPADDDVRSTDFEYPKSIRICDKYAYMKNMNIVRVRVCEHANVNIMRMWISCECEYEYPANWM